MATVIPRREVIPIDLMLRNVLGRDLTAEERKYLALSAIAMPIQKNESLASPPRLRAQEKGGQRLVFIR